MIKIIDIDKDIENIKPSVIGLGNFDGVHLGHKDIMRKVIEVGRDKDLTASVLLFKEHTNEIFKNRPSEYLSSLHDKIEYLAKEGIEQVFIINFTKEFGGLTNEEFMLDFVGDRLNGESIVVGEDYTFGKYAAGNVEDLKKYHEAGKIDVNIVKPNRYHDEVTSSTMVRALISDGKVKEASNLLERPYRITGKVVDGEKRGGKILGFPTANIDLSFPYIIPGDGLYLTNIIIDGIKHPSMTSIGTNPTFTDGKDIKIETFILNFSGSIYGECIQLEFLEWMRGQIKFDGKEALILQMEKDLDKAKKYFKI